MKYLVIGFLWAAYCALHSFLISTSFTKLMARLLKKYYAFYRLFFNIISIILLIPLIKFTAHQDNNIIITYTPALNIIRYILITCTLLIFISPFLFNYDILSFFGIRQIFNFGKKDDTSREINKTGLLGIVRHPMYFALIIYLWCQTFRIADIVVNTVLTIYIIIGTLLEEKKLVLEYGDSYIKYQKEVPMLIPFTK